MIPQAIELAKRDSPLSVYSCVRVSAVDVRIYIYRIASILSALRIIRSVSMVINTHGALYLKYLSWILSQEQ